MNHSNLFYGGAASSTEGCPTPSTTMSEDMPIREEWGETLNDDDHSSDNKYNKTKKSKPSHDNHVHHMEHPPIPGRVCMIRTRQQPHRILGLKEGKLEFLDRLSPAWGVYWSCSEIGNFLYFRSTASGENLGYLTSSGSHSYLASANGGKIVTTKDYREAKQNFVAVRQEGGGHILHTFHPETTKLRQVVVTEDKNGGFLREQDKGGTPLDFIDAKYVRYSVSIAVPDMERESLLEG
ncbi:hypothetical protein GGI42DRAFT_361313 [Trichoderma sp. SZMC 28013]